MMMMITIMAVVSVGLRKRKVDGDVCDGLCVTLGVCVIRKAFKVFLRLGRRGQSFYPHNHPAQPANQ